MKRDNELLEAWRTGDRHAAAELIDRYAARLHRFFASRAGSSADDLCQQTFEACVRSREKIEADGLARSFRSFLFGIARRRLVDHYRSAGGEAGRVDPLDGSIEDPSPSTSRVAAGREEADLVASALQQLPPDYRMVLELHYWEGLSTAEMATALDAPVGTVKTRLARGRKRLKEEIAALASTDAVRDAALSRTEELARALGRA